MAATRLHPGLLSSIATGLDPTAKMAAQAVSGFLPSMKQARQEEREKERQRQKLLTLNAYERGLSSLTNVDGSPITADQRADVLSGMLQLGTEQKIDFTPEDIRDLRTRSKETRESLTEEKERENVIKAATAAATKQKLSKEDIDIITSSRENAQKFLDNNRVFKATEYTTEIVKEIRNGKLKHILRYIPNDPNKEPIERELGEAFDEDFGKSSERTADDLKSSEINRIHDKLDASEKLLAEAETLDSLVIRSEQMGKTGGVWANLKSGILAELGLSDPEYLAFKADLASVQVEKAIQNLPTGPASDKDIALVLSTTADLTTLDPEKRTSYLRGVAKIKRLHAQRKKAEANYMKNYADSFALGFDEHYNLHQANERLHNMQDKHPDVYNDYMKRGLEIAQLRQTNTVESHKEADKLEQALNAMIAEPSTPGNPNNYAIMDVYRRSQMAATEKIKILPDELKERQIR